MALTVTGAGGLCLLAGVLILGHIVGSYDMDRVLAAGDLVRADPWYPAVLALVALGALTKSAQFPFQFWLPNAMAAPTPVSAYLHSATMVKAGVFLLARFWPVLAGTDAWFWIIGGAGLITLVLGAYAAIFQQDMKGVLAYSTISHLGLITLLLGLNSSLALVAAIFHMVNHATFKASLFMAAGIVDHETGTRDLGRLSGLYKPCRSRPRWPWWRPRPWRGAAAQRLHLERDVLRRNHLRQRRLDHSRRAAAGGYRCRRLQRGLFAALHPAGVLRAAGHRPAARAARAAALDAVSQRAAGVHVPAGRRVPGVHRGSVPGHGRAEHPGRGHARIQPGRLARREPAAGHERGRHDGGRGAVPGAARAPAGQSRPRALHLPLRRPAQLRDAAGRLQRGGVLARCAGWRPRACRCRCC